MITEEKLKDAIMKVLTDYNGAIDGLFKRYNAKEELNNETPEIVLSTLDHLSENDNIFKVSPEFAEEGAKQCGSVEAFICMVLVLKMIP